MDNGTGIPCDLCPLTEIPGLGTGIGTASLGALGTGTNIAETVPGQKSMGQPNPKLKSQGQKSLGLAVPSHAHPLVISN